MKKRVLRHPVLCFVIFMVFAAIISGISVYSLGRDKVTLMRKINIVTIDEKTYFVAEENKKWCILKECIQYGDDVAINNGHYMVSSLINRDVYVIELDTGVKSYLVDAKEYSQILLK